jgi:hypothetical protein
MKHYKQYVLRNKKGSPHFAFGNALDAVLEDRINSIINKGTIATREESKSMWEGVYRTALDKLSPEEIWGFDIEEMLQKGLAHVDLFIDEIQDTLRPKSAQHRIYWDIWGNGEIYVRMDLDYVDLRDWFADWKTMGNKPALNWVNRKKAAMLAGLPDDSSKEFKAQYKKENETDTFIDPKYYQQVRTYFAGLFAEGLVNYKKAFLVEFIKNLKKPVITKQKIVIDDPEKNAFEMWNILTPMIQGVIDNYEETGEAPMQTGLYLPSAYGGGICDMCEVREIVGPKCGVCRK